MQVTPDGKHLLPSRRTPKGTVEGPDGKHYDFDHYKACGNALYVKGEFAAAAKSYSNALEAAGGTVQGEWVGDVMSSPEKQRSGLLAEDELLVPASDVASCYSNRAACHMALHSYAAAEFDTTVALELQPDYVKALYRRGQAREALQEFSKAREDMRRVLKLDPSVKAAEQAIPRLQELAEAQQAAASSAASDGKASPRRRAEEELIKIVEYDPKQPVLAQILANRKRLLAIHKGGRLGATDIADYKKFISGLAKRLKDTQPVIERRTQLLRAKAKQRNADCDNALRRQQAVIEEWTCEKALMEKEYAWLVSQPAYQQTQAIVKERFKQSSTGHLYDVEEAWRRPARHADT